MLDHINVVANATYGALKVIGGLSFISSVFAGNTNHPRRNVVPRGLLVYGILSHVPFV